MIRLENKARMRRKVSMPPEMTLPILTLKTDPALLARLTKAATQPATKEELHQQRISFVLGNLPTGSQITREQVEAALARADGETKAA
jgi:hypothetical protein